MASHKRHGIVFRVIGVALILSIYSFFPVIGLYFKRVPEPYKNEDVIKKLGSNKDAYFSFIVLSDTSSGCFAMESSSLKLISRMNREDRFKKVPIDCAINIGDVTFRGKEKHYKSYSKIRGLIKYPVLTAIGNHDDDLDNGPKGMELFNRYCGEAEFSFSNRNAYFIFLDNKNSNLSQDQFEWFRVELSKAKAFSHTFVFMHKPPFNPYQQSWYRIETCPWSYKFMKMCQENGVTAVFSGHEYIHRVVDFGGVKYFVSGGGGALLHEAPSWDNASLHYFVIKVNGDYIDYEIRKVFPPLWLYFTFYFWKDLIYFGRDLLN